MLSESDHPDWKNKVILVAEDKDINFILFDEVLKSTGLILLRTRNGEETVEMCRNNPNINLILMDIKMPVMNGFEATRLIREFRSNLPIIAQTASAMSGEEEKALEAGCNDYIAKPISPKRLIKTIEKYL